MQHSIMYKNCLNEISNYASGVAYLHENDFVGVELDGRFYWVKKTHLIILFFIEAIRAIYSADASHSIASSPFWPSRNMHLKN